MKKFVFFTIHLVALIMAITNAIAQNNDVFKIQIGVFRAPNLQKINNELSGISGATVYTEESPKGTRIVIGYFPDRASADIILPKVKAKYPDAYVTAHKNPPLPPKPTPAVAAPPPTATTATTATTTQITLPPPAPPATQAVASSPNALTNNEAYVIELDNYANIAQATQNSSKVADMGELFFEAMGNENTLLLCSFYTQESADNNLAKVKALGFTKAKLRKVPKDANGKAIIKRGGNSNSTPPPPTIPTTSSTSTSQAAVTLPDVSMNSFLSLFKPEHFDIALYVPYDPSSTAKDATFYNDNYLLRGTRIPNQLLYNMNELPPNDPEVSFYAVEQFQITPNYIGCVIRKGKLNNYLVDNIGFLLVFDKSNQRFIQKILLSEYKNDGNVGYIHTQSNVSDLNLDGVLDICSFTIHEGTNDKGFFKTDEKLTAYIWQTNQFIEGSIPDPSALKAQLKFGK